MIHLCDEFHLEWLVGVAIWDLDVYVEDAFFVG